MGSTSVLAPVLESNLVFPTVSCLFEPMVQYHGSQKLSKVTLGFFNKDRMSGAQEMGPHLQERPKSERMGGVSSEKGDNG